MFLSCHKRTRSSSVISSAVAQSSMENIIRSMFIAICGLVRSNNRAFRGNTFNILVQNFVPVAVESVVNRILGMSRCLVLLYW